MAVKSAAKKTERIAKSKPAKGKGKAGRDGTGSSEEGTNDKDGGVAGHQDEEGEDGSSKSSRKPKPGKVERTGKRKRPALPRGSVDDSVLSVCQNIIQIDLGGAERDKETSHNTMLRNLVNIVASRGQARQVPVLTTQT